MTLKFDTPATRNPIDQLKVIGQPLDRVDGPLKVSGMAPYAYERHDVVPNQAYGVIVGAAIARGSITRIDTRAARAAPGVLAVVTYENAGKVGKAKEITTRLLGGPEVDHFDQAVAIVVAESFEQARSASHLLDIEYQRSAGQFDLEQQKDAAVKPKSVMGEPADTAVGDFASAFGQAPVKIDQTYTTPDHSHSAM
ncbi:hypothetical protein BH09PSE6_BH09PSE6_27550 [soil metagenome]